MEASGGREWLWIKLGLALVGQAMLNKSSINFLLLGRGVFLLCGGLRPNCGRGDGGNSSPLQKDLCQHATTPRTAVLSAPDPAAGTVNLCPEIPGPLYTRVWLSLL